MPADDRLDLNVRLLLLLLNPAIIGIFALFLSVLWMLKDQRDKARPLLVFALTLNLFFGFLLTVLMGREGGLLPWKYDRILFALDRALGLTAAAIALPLAGLLPDSADCDLSVDGSHDDLLVPRHSLPEHARLSGAGLCCASWLPARSCMPCFLPAGPSTPLARSGFIPSRFS